MSKQITANNIKIEDSVHKQLNIVLIQDTIHQSFLNLLLKFVVNI